ncbi:MAG: exonuclease SbcCD subunit D [Colwellia sp.]
MKFIHTSDWHIGRQFHHVSLLKDQQHVISQLVEYIQQEEVDALVIAGDIYDRSLPPAKAVSLLDETFNKICIDLNVPIILIPGNHDSAERLRFGSKHMQSAGLHILGDLTKITEPVIIKGKNHDVAFYGIPYNDPQTVKHTFDVDVSSYDEAHSYLVNCVSSAKSSEQINVLISHCYIDGATESDSERPLQIGGEDRVSFEPCLPFDYVALGHLHSPQYKGAEHIRYCGSLMKYSFSERNQKKGVTLVEFDEKGVMQHKHLELKPLKDLRVISGELNSILEEGKLDPNSNDYLLIKLEDTHAILDPMGKLRNIYPNVLHLEKTVLSSQIDNPLKRDSLNRGEYAMFKDFFQQVTGEEMTNNQDEIITQLLNTLKK